ncbi:bifunctional DedA family/phosphatase PAP2 family protein [Luteimonas vadosa]|uniref:Bifunctional DedA family/phosphatase PAP2 family protein n=1 Tax=Luteimonas vadosa TaxID=1165507 RepID=A0ABP9DTJ8_9GAMM
MSASLDTLVAWIGTHPVAAGALIFAIAFCDAAIVLGALVPAMPLIFAVGVLVGLGEVSGPYAVVCAALGAFCGDGMSFWIGRRWGPRLRTVWPFVRYPQLLERGEKLFRRNAAKSILVARYVGPVRPFVPAVAGMLEMPVKRYVPVSAVAAVSWAALYLLPGWLLGEAYDAVAAVADRLAIVMVALAAAVALAWASVLYSYRWFAGHADSLLARALKWTHAHPRLGRYAAALIDPNRPESASLAILAVCLLAIGWAWFALLATVLARGEPLLLDQQVHEAMYALRNPLADRLMAALATIGDPQVLVPAAGLALSWLLLRRRWIAAAHWIAALAFGLALTAALGVAIDMPRPPQVTGGFGFPSVAVTMTTITFGFFAVLIAREFPGRQRVWPYLVSGAVVALLGFARLYLGAHWLSDIVGGMLLGIVWLLLLGIAYRRHVARSMWMRPLAALFYGSFLAAAGWHAPRAIDSMLSRFEPPAPVADLDRARWWTHDWAALPAQRNERADSRRWPLDVQVAGPLAPLRERLQAQGWRVQPQAGWRDTIGLLDDGAPPARQPVLPATLDASAESLLLRRPLPDGRLHVLRLWAAPRQFADGTPLWIGATQTLVHARPFGVFGLWQPGVRSREAYVDLRAAMDGFDVEEGLHPGSGTPVLRLRTGPRND